MSTLYELTGNYVTLMDMLDDPEVDPITLMDTLDAVEGELDEKAENYGRIIRNLEAEAEAIRDKIKGEMISRDTEELVAGRYIVRWTSVLSSRFDSTAFKREHADLYKDYVKQVSSKRFSVAA